MKYASIQKLDSQTWGLYGKTGSGINIKSLEEAKASGERIGFPVIVRPSFTLGGTGGGVAYNQQELKDMVTAGLDLSLNSEVMLERSLLGWKEMGRVLILRMVQ